LFVVILIPFNNCSKPFAVSEESESFSSLTTGEDLVYGQKLYQQHCASCHGVIHASTKKDKSAETILAAFGTVRAMASLSSKLDSKQVASIALALKSPKTNDGRIQFACTPDLAMQSSIHRLSNRELKNTIASLLKNINSSLVPDAELSRLISELPIDNKSKKENTFLVTPEIINGHFEVAYYLGNYIAKSDTAKRSFPGTSGCLLASPITQACANNFIKELGGLAFRRPLSNTEIENLATAFSDSSLTTDIERIANVVSIVVMSPDFLYLIYDGGTPKADGKLALTSYEYASKISFLLTGAPPDSVLRDLAKSGAILNSDVAAGQVNRLIKTDLGKESIQRFFKEWTHYDQFEGFNYSSEVLNGQSLENLRQAMEREINEFLVDVVVSNEGTYKELLMSTNSFVYDNSLAQIYGIANPLGKVGLASQHRAGLLTRAAFLTKRSGPLTSPVKRGLLIKEAFLCEGVGSPPPDAPSMLEPLPVDTYLTTRDRLEHLTMKTGTSCVNCHTSMNNLGFPFEMYDTLGRVRDKERIFKPDGAFSGVELPIDTKAESKDIESSVIQIADAVDLSSKLSNNDKALSCFVSKWTEFHLRRTPASGDGCLMNESLNTIYGKDSNQGSIQELIRNTIRSEHFKNWNYLSK
tara:strand:- start:16982 stop:18904 length:1923 start_codon:yes stop_codon:yes gene_type:complete